MPGTFTPAQMYDHELNPLKGWPSPYAVDYSAAYATGETGVVAGMCCSLDGNGNLVRGGITGSEMAIFIFQSQTDFDVLSDVGNIAGGVASGLVACGSYELQTTEFVADTYAPNDPLTVITAAGATQGQLTIGVVGTDPIVGVVSSGQTNSEHNASITFLAFWPVYVPV